MKITHCRLAAPSFKALAMAGMGRPKKGYGHVPTNRVIIVTDAQGYQYQHFKIFQSGEINKAMEIMHKIDAAGQVNPAHWRYAHKEY